MGPWEEQEMVEEELLVELERGRIDGEEVEMVRPQDRGGLL